MSTTKRTRRAVGGSAKPPEATQHHFEVLGVDVEVDPKTRKLSGRTTGALGGDFGDKLDEYLGKLNQGKVLAVRRGGNVYSLYQPPVPSAANARVIAHRIKRFGLNQSVPSTATMSVTYACQCKCRHCSAVHYMARGKGAGAARELSTAEFCKVMDQAVALGVVNIALSGGEPLLRKDLMSIIGHVPPDQANIMLFTNGILLTEERVKKLADSNLFAVMISIDSSDPKEHDYYRRYPNLFNIAMQGAERALTAGLLVGFSTYATRESLASGELERRMALAHKMGVHELTVFDPVPTGMYLDREDIILTAEERARIVELAAVWSRKPGHFKVTPQALVNSPQGAGCFAGYHQFYMTAHGDVCPCDFTPLTFGNVRKEPLAAIWARMTSHPAYCHREGNCRMQNKEFRKRYIGTIPKDAPTPFLMGDRPKVGVLAGFGEFPVLFTKEIQRAGYDVVVVAIDDEAGSALSKAAPRLQRVGVGDMDKVIGLFKGQGVQDIVMVGKVHKDKLFAKVPMDVRMKRVVGSLKVKDDASILKAIGEELEREGLMVREPTEYLQSLLVAPGVLSRRQPTEAEMADVAYGYRIAKDIASLGIGQTVVVKGGTILAVEAIEGTDKAIIRASSLSNGGAVVVKVSAPNHDMRFDTPVIGTDTINTLFASGAKVLAVEAGKTIILNREAVVEKADDRGIAIVAL